MTHLKTDKALTKVFSKYANFTDVFSPKLAVKFSKYIKINNYAIELVNDWQIPYSPIYSLSPVELETLKIYIKNNLANSFIRPFKFFIRAPFFFNKKLNKSLRLCIDYYGLNNLTRKNWYPLFLVGKLLD